MLRKFPVLLMGRIALALGLLGTLLAVAGRSLFPTVETAHLLLVAAVACAALLVMLALAAWVTGSLHQWILRRGGTDTQWLWFSTDPPGLAQLRANPRTKGTEPL